MRKSKRKFLETQKKIEPPAPTPAKSEAKTKIRIGVAMYDNKSPTSKIKCEASGLKAFLKHSKNVKIYNPADIAEKHRKTIVRLKKDHTEDLDRIIATHTVILMDVIRKIVSIYEKKDKTGIAKIKELVKSWDKETGSKLN